MSAASQLFLHGFGQRYDLPIALPVYLFAAAAVVVLSFLMVVLFAGERQGQRAVSYPRRELRFLPQRATIPATVTALRQPDRLRTRLVQSGSTFF